MLPASTASVPPASEASVPPVRICSTTADDIILLCEVAGHKQPFARASLAWEEVAASLGAFCGRLRGVTAHAVKDRTISLVKSYTAEDKFKKM